MKYYYMIDQFHNLKCSKRGTCLNCKLAIRNASSNLTCQQLKEIVRCYNVEAKWFQEGHIPLFEEYLKIAFITSTNCYLPISSLMGIQSVLEEDFEWLSKKPKLIMASLEVCRFIDDMATYEVYILSSYLMSNKYEVNKQYMYDTIDFTSRLINHFCCARMDVK